MKRNKLFIAGLVTVFVALCSLTLVSSTWAKYTSTASGEDSATVAKWEWTYSEQNAAAGKLQDTVEFDLFNTIKDTKGANETNVAANLIAPGTQGEFTFTLSNNSQVNAQYKITFTSELVGTDSAYLPIKFNITDNEGNEVANQQTSTTLSSFNVAFEPIAMGESVTYTISWVWAFAGNDTSDTDLGIDAQSGEVKYNVEMTILMEQVD